VLHSIDNFNSGDVRVTSQIRCCWQVSNSGQCVWHASGEVYSRHVSLTWSQKRFL